MLLAACANGGLVVELPTDAGPRVTYGESCSADAQCPAGMVCGACGGGTACAPGCRSADQCSPGEVCVAAACTACPCAPGWCVSDPCLDRDGDGYAQTSDPAVQCPGKLKGDCADTVAGVNPGRLELCSNGVDDNCDGKVDLEDPTCAPSCGNATVCARTSDCALGASCQRRCCEACEPPYAPQCGQFGQCAVPSGVQLATGCLTGSFCRACGDCEAAPLAQVCGTNGATYRNRCQAEAARAVVAHPGACLPREGMDCTSAATFSLTACGAGAGLYCREQVIVEGGLPVRRCTQVGACLKDADCPAGAPVQGTCDGGPGVQSCVDNACVLRCRD